MVETTIAIPFYNNENTIENTIKSVLNQSYKDWILILINDGSTDGSVKIAEKYVSNKIILLNDGKNKGLIFRLNQAIKLTETPYFVRMDSDDIMAPNRLEKQIEYLKLNSEVDLVGANTYIIDEFNNIISFRKATYQQRNVEDILKKGLFIHPTVTARTEWFKKNLYHADFERAEDLELWCRKIDGLNYFQFEEPLLFYRDPMNMDINKYKKSFITRKKVINKYLTGFKKNKWVLKENLKYIIYYILDKIKMSGFLSRRRNSTLEEEKLLLAKQIFKDALK